MKAFVAAAKKNGFASDTHFVRRPTELIIEDIEAAWAPQPLRRFARFALRLGFNRYRSRHDRRVLEDSIFPYLASHAPYARVLFVGCAWYTGRYNAFFAHKEYWTLDIDPRRRRYGSSRHVVGSLAELRTHFADGSLDAIVCNGVFGWGLNARDAVEAAFAGCFACLREGGVLIVGWNDVPRRRPFALESCESLQAFRRWAFPPLSTARYLTRTANRHTYDFYLK